MKTSIIYKSYHHQNTYRLIKHLKDKYNFELLNVDEIDNDVHLSKYDYIGLASGIYGFEFHKDIISLISKGNINNKKVFLIFTSSLDKASFASSIKKELLKFNNEIIGVYHTKGFTTFGPLKLLGGVNKNRPNESDFVNLDLFLEKTYFQPNS